MLGLKQVWAVNRDVWTVEGFHSMKCCKVYVQECENISEGKRSWR